MKKIEYYNQVIKDCRNKIRRKNVKEGELNQCKYYLKKYLSSLSFLKKGNIEEKNKLTDIFKSDFPEDFIDK